MSLAIIGLLFLIVPARGETPLDQARVSAAVTDLRRQPSKAPVGLEYDADEESQLLYGDLVQVLEEKEGWLRVAAAEQLEFTHTHRWEGYPGWVEKSDVTAGPADWQPTHVVTARKAFVRGEAKQDAEGVLTLSFGTGVMEAEEHGQKRKPAKEWLPLLLLDGSIGWIPAGDAVSVESLDQLQDDPIRLRNQLVETARRFLGDPYYWGGRSIHDPDAPAPPNTGLDCSGLVGLVYQANGMSIPRDAHEQWLNARKIQREQMQPGDLVFLFDPNQPNFVNHVMLYAGNDRVIEGAGTHGSIREIPLNDRLQENQARRTAYGSYR
jgi:gamma-D-glutamyl-L-lysine dipeptidyl-peptidase